MSNNATDIQGGLFVGAWIETAVFRLAVTDRSTCDLSANTSEGVEDRTVDTTTYISDPQVLHCAAYIGASDGTPVQVRADGTHIGQCQLVLHIDGTIHHCDTLDGA